MQLVACRLSTVPLEEHLKGTEFLSAGAGIPCLAAEFAKRQSHLGFRAFLHLMLANRNER